MTQKIKKGCAFKLEDKRDVYITIHDLGGNMIAKVQESKSLAAGNYDLKGSLKDIP